MSCPNILKWNSSHNLHNVHTEDCTWIVSAVISIIRIVGWHFQYVCRFGRWQSNFKENNRSLWDRTISKIRFFRRTPILLMLSLIRRLTLNFPCRILNSSAWKSWQKWSSCSSIFSKRWSIFYKHVVNMLPKKHTLQRDRDYF